MSRRSSAPRSARRTNFDSRNRERSIVEMAREMGSSWNVHPGPLQDHLRVFFAQLPTG